MSNSSADTADTTPPNLVERPTDGQAANGPLVFSFSEAIKLGADASLYLSAGSKEGLTIALTGNPAVTLSGSTLTVQVPQQLDFVTQYNARFSAGAITDLSGNPAFSGQSYDLRFRSGLSPVALERTGSSGDDTLDGSDLADKLGGGEGRDTLNGHGGNDDLRGGIGDDTLNGGAGNDELHGEAGNDRLNGDAGDDLLEGGAGDDELLGGGGANTLRGGDGKDALIGSGGSEYDGGAGDDRIRLSLDAQSGNPTRASGGDGNDWFELGLYSPAAGRTTLAGGAGVDTYVPGFGQSVSLVSALPEVIISDFTAGAGGDLIDIGSHHGDNPFASGDRRLVASGADTLLQVRLPWSGNYLTMLTLAGVAPSQVLAANFVGGFDPNGGTAGLTLTGTEGSDTLDGMSLDDTLIGLGGHDLLNGGEGNDLLDGGDGNDTLNGDAGNDTLRGGNGDDQLFASYFGDNLLEGGAGNDRLRSHGGGSDKLFGGDGDDSLLLMGNSTGRDAKLTVTMSGGAGNDQISLVVGGRVAKVIASGGEGADLYYFDGVTHDIDYTILDFEAADQLDLQRWLPYGITENPFATGHWKAVQEGSDVGIYIDRDGAAGDNPGFRLLTLAKLSLAALGKANFVGGFDPAGGSHGGAGPIGRTLTGGLGDDVLHGHDLNDTLDGRAGNDSISGFGGDDLLVGGDGDDRLDGGHGNDRLDGGEGKDTLGDSTGDDYLSGGGGDDVLASIGSSSGRPAGTVLDGGAGNDRFQVGDSVKSVLGGAGDDVVEVQEEDGPAGRAPLLVELGEGNDQLILRTGVGESRALRVSGGAGVDTYKFPSGHSRPTVTITDFQTGAGGDVLDVFSFAFTYGEGNPVGPRLVQDGSHVLLQVDPDGALGAQSWLTRVVFENTRVADFTAENLPGGAGLVGGPSGGGTPGGTDGLVLTGTAADDQLVGGSLSDLLRGADGNDFIMAGDGNDRLDGGAGNDVLNGEAGDDELLGGAGDDTLEDYLGNNILRGGEGKDQLHNGPAGSAQVFGEAGDDFLFVKGNGQFDGGEGEDGFFISLDKAAAARPQLSGGAGSDFYVFATAATGAVVTITDFVAGAGGDFIDAEKLVATPSGNPFAPGGSLQFVQRGPDTVLQVRVSKDGAASFQDVLVLRDLAKTALTSENIFLFFDPHGGIRGKSAQGGGGADQLAGTVYEDTLSGGAGNDVLVGGGGYDVLDGGSGIDNAVFSGARSQYAVQRVLHDPQDAVVSDLRPGPGDGKDRVIGIERLVFSDGAIALDTGDGGAAGQAYRIYRAAFDRVPDEAGLGFWIAMMDRGGTLADIAGGVVRSQEFIGLYGAAPGNADLVTRLYRNILDRDPEQAGFDFWVNALDKKLVDLPTLLAQFSESGENRAAVAELIANGVQYQPYA